MRYISICTGGGGLDRGLELVQREAKCVCAVEIEAFAVATLVAQMQNGILAPAPVWTDARTFDGKPWRGAVDCIVAGFPCQDISSAGKRAGIHGKRSELWFSVARIIREVRPRYVFLENVDDLIVRGVDAVLEGLAEMGFAGAWGVFSAAEVGATQLRERWFYLGVGQADAEKFRRREGWAESTRLVGRFDADLGSNALADTASERPGETRRLRARQPLRPGRSGEVVDDSNSGRRNGTGDSIRSGRHRPERPIADVGNAECGGCRQAADSVSRSESESGFAGEDRDGVDLVDAIRPRLEGHDAGQCGCARRGSVTGPTGAPVLADANAAGCGEQRGVVIPDNGQTTCGHDADGRSRPSAILDTFPPGRSDYDGWQRVVECAPELTPALTESALRGVADGMALAHRIDLLRLLGNGVVPQQAAYAYRVLRERLMKEGLWPMDVDP